MQYRPEIDGLRAIAVVPVILFHAGFSLFSGGYIGVDVFFVISGYLITGILIKDLDNRTFSLAGFYDRRIRRILPALFFVLFACLPIAYLWLPPPEMEDFARSLIAVVFFASNLLFWRETGYFGAEAEITPLLHTWSLAVEEQFYLAFPLLLLLIWRFGKGRVAGVLFALAVASFVLAEWGWRHSPAATFYLAPTRLWELLAGGLCAFVTTAAGRQSSDLLSMLGLSMIVVALFAYDATTPFPSVYTLVPVLGTALVLVFAGPDTRIARALSMRVLVWIGLISYSAYLWHQPLFAFARLRSVTEPHPVLMAVLAVLSLLLAWGTWAFVEQPFRRGRHANPQMQGRRFAIAGGVSAVLGAIGGIGLLTLGLEQRFDPTLVAIARTERNTPRCMVSEAAPVLIRAGCGPQGQGDIDVVLIGDSHAEAVRPALTQVFESEGLRVAAATYGGCPPVGGLARYDTPPRHDCAGFNARMVQHAQQTGADVLVFVARHQIYLHGSRFQNGEGGNEHGAPLCLDLAGRATCRWDDPARKERLLAQYEAQITELAKHVRIVLVHPVPEAGWDVPRMAFWQSRGQPGSAEVSTALSAYETRSAEIAALFDSLAARSDRIFAAPVQQALCSAGTGRCLNADAKGVYYHDDDHLSLAGAKLIAPIVLQAVRAALRAD